MPVLGAPLITTLRPSRSNPALAHAAAQVREGLLEGLKAPHHLPVRQEIDLLVGKVDGCLHVDPEVGETVRQGVDLLRQNPAQRVHGRARGGRGAALDQVGHRFRLGKIQPAGEKGAFAELPRPSQPGAQVQALPDEHLHGDRAAVTLQFQNILPGIAARGGKADRDALVDHPAGSIPEFLQAGPSRRGQVTGQTARDAGHQGPGKPDDADSPASRRRGQGDNGISLPAGFLLRSSGTSA